MFGLEGSGFIISISLTFLLVGLVVYLMKRQMRGLEQKFCSIFELSQNLATSIEHIKHTQQDRRKEIHINNYSESENDTDDECDSDQGCPGGICPINRMFESIKVIDINDNHEKPFNFENNALHDILNPSIEDLDNKDKNASNKKNLQVEDLDEEGSEEVSDEEGSEEVSDEEGSEEDYEEGSDEEGSEEGSDEEGSDKEDLKKSVSEDRHSTKEDLNIKNSKEHDKSISARENTSLDEINYHKLKVQHLRDLVVKQNILSEREVKTIKKQELVDLLKKNN